jgi:hypothetical protein
MTTFKTKDEKDDHDWLEILAGRFVTNPDPDVERQALMLRQVMKQRKTKETINNYLGESDGNLGDC